MLTLENEDELNLQTYTIDFEKALINPSKEIFGNIRQMGCYYHYCRNVRAKAVEYKLFNSFIKVLFNELINELYKLPFIYQKNNNYIDILKKAFIQENKVYADYFNYFESQWIPYFINGMLDYHYLEKEQRSNSYIENYNRRIKLKLSKYLYGKNHCKVSWPLFLYFIKQEEEDYRLENYNLEQTLIIKSENVKKLKYKNLNTVIEKNNYKKNSDNKNRKWFKWNYNSCIYECFSLVYCFIIISKFDEFKETPQNAIYLKNILS